MILLLVAEHFELGDESLGAAGQITGLDAQFLATGTEQHTGGKAGNLGPGSIGRGAMARPPVHTGSFQFIFLV